MGGAEGKTPVQQEPPLPATQRPPSTRHPLTLGPGFLLLTLTFEIISKYNVFLSVALVP